LCPRGLYGAPSWDSNCPANGRRAAAPAKQPNVVTRTAEEWRRASFWAHHPARVADGCYQAQHHAGDSGTTAVRLRDADHENTAERHGHPGA
jgi:hypothetical protein